MELYKLTAEQAAADLHVLYRYAPWNPYTIDVITHQHLYLASASQMNDEWEFRIPYVHHNDLIGTLEDMFQGQSANFTEDDVLIEEPFQDQNGVLHEADVQVINSDRDNIGIACFSNCENNPMMWYHYADKYRGICLEFTNIFGETTNGIEGVVGPVSYGDYPHIDIVSQARLDPQHIALMYRYFHKSTTWQQEHEYRYITYICDGRSRYFPFGDTVLTAIYCGFRMSPCDIQLVYDLAMLYNRSVAVYTSALGENDFGFTFSRYEP